MAISANRLELLQIADAAWFWFWRTSSVNCALALATSAGSGTLLPARVHTETSGISSHTSIPARSARSCTSCPC